MNNYAESYHPNKGHYMVRSSIWLKHHSHSPQQKKEIHQAARGHSANMLLKILAFLKSKAQKTWILFKNETNYCLKKITHIKTKSIYCAGHMTALGETQCQLLEYDSSGDQHGAQLS